MSSERVGQVKKALGIFGTFLFGDDDERDKKAREIAKATKNKVQEVRRRRGLNGAIDAIDTEGDDP